MDKIYRKLFWGFVITTFQMTIGAITILPEVIGWMVVMDAFVDWGNKRQKRGVPQLKLLGVLLIISSLIYTARMLFYPSASSNHSIWLFFPVVLFLIQFMLCHKILESSIMIFQEIKDKRSEEKYSLHHSFYIILTAVAFLFLFHSILLYNNFSHIIASLVFLLAKLYMLFILYSLSKQERVSLVIE